MVDKNGFHAPHPDEWDDQNNISPIFSWEMIENDLDIRVCVLTGADGNFSSGMDLRSLSGDSDETDDYDVKKRMEEEGIVGAPNHVGKREILLAANE